MAEKLPTSLLFYPASYVILWQAALKVKVFPPSHAKEREELSPNLDAQIDGLAAPPSYRSGW